MSGLGCLDAGKALQGRQDFILLLFAQDRFVQHKIRQEADAAAFAFFSIDRNPGEAQGIDIPANGPPGYTERFGQFPGGYFLFVEQDIDDFKEPVCLHVLSPAPLYHKNVTTVCRI